MIYYISKTGRIAIWYGQEGVTTYPTMNMAFDAVMKQLKD